MRLIASIEKPAVIEKILTHLGLWPATAHSPPATGRPLPLSLQRVIAASPARHPAREVGRRAGRRRGERGPPADRRGPIGVPPACVSLPLTPVAGAPDTPPDPGARYGGTRAAGVGRSRWLPPGSRRGPRLDRHGAPKSKSQSPSYHPYQFTLSPNGHGVDSPPVRVREPLDPAGDLPRGGRHASGPPRPNSRMFVARRKRSTSGKAKDHAQALRIGDGLGKRENG
jgi:hypothetical protein